MSQLPERKQPNSTILFYQTEDGRSRIEVRLENNTVWLPQALLAELFQTTVPNISMHIRNILGERELLADSVIKEFLTTAADGKKYVVSFYSLSWKPPDRLRRKQRASPRRRSRRKAGNQGEHNV